MGLNELVKFGYYFFKKIKLKLKSKVKICLIHFRKIFYKLLNKTKNIFLIC